MSLFSAPEAGRVDVGRRTLTLRRRRVAVRLEWRSIVVCAVLALAVAGLTVQRERRQEVLQRLPRPPAQRRDPHAAEVTTHA